MARAHRESSMSKLDYDAKRVANIYMELPCYILFQPINDMFYGTARTEAKRAQEVLTAFSFPRNEKWYHKCNDFHIARRRSY